MYAYAYLKLLQIQNLWPADLGRRSIAEAIQRAETIPDPVPEEGNSSCQYSRKHCPPEYRRHRQYGLEALDNRAGLCFVCIKSGSGTPVNCQVSH
jgi:hypothetical protein